MDMPDGELTLGPGVCVTPAYVRDLWLSAIEAQRDLLVEVRTPRSSKWPALRARWLKQYPTCAACGQSDRVAVHHKQPFHLFPELELDEGNLLTLCEEGPGKCNCHLLIGHGGDWRLFNSQVDTDAGNLLRMLQRVRGEPVRDTIKHETH